MQKKFVPLILILFLSVFADAQTTEFTYQGRLFDGAMPPTANYDFEFRLFDALSGGTQIGATETRSNVAVASGIFTVKLDFGASFTGAARFLEIAVRRSSAGGAYTTLAPLQPFTSSPYSIRSVNAGLSDALSAACNLCVTDAQIQSIAGNKFTGVITGNGAGLTNLNGGNIATGTVTSSQLSAEAVPNTTAYKLLGSLRWDLLKPQANFSVGASQYGIVFDGTNIWTANFNANSVSKIRAADGAILGTFPVASSARGIAFDGANIWVSNHGSGSVTKLRASDGVNLGNFPVGTNPNGIAFDGTNIWVANDGSNNVTKLRASDGVNLGTFAAGINPNGIAFDGANIWTANSSSNNVTKLRATDGANLGSFVVGSLPVGIAFDGVNIWVANFGGNNVSRLRASDGVSLGNIAVGSTPQGIAFDGSNIWTANRSSNTVTKLRASDGVNLGTFPVGLLPSAVAFDGANIWTAHLSSNFVTRLLPAFP